MTLQWFEWDLTHPWELVPKKASIGGFDIGNDNRMRWWLMAFFTSKLVPKHSNEDKYKRLMQFHPKLRWFQLWMFEMWNEKRIGAEKPRNGFHTNLNFPQEIKPGITSYTYTYTYKYTHTYMYTYTYNIHDPLSSWIVCKFHSPAISTFWKNFISDKRWNSWVFEWGS